MKKARWIAVWVLAAMAAVGAGQRAWQHQARESSPGRASSARISQLPPATGAATARGNSGADPAVPDPQQRLLEQIETARLGLLAAQAAHPLVPPESHSPLSAEWVGLSLLMTFLLGAWLWSRRRLQQQRSKNSTAAGLPAIVRGLRAVKTQAIAVTVPAKLELAVPAPPPAVVALEGRMRMLEDSLLQVVRAVEASAVRPASPPPADLPVRPDRSRLSQSPSETPPVPSPLPPPAPTPAVRESENARISEPPWRRAGAPDIPEPRGRGPAADHDLSLPPPTTNDGRELPRIRRAVLRLAAEGWSESKIAQKLRLGSGDVSLILKTGEPRSKAGHAEMAGSRR